MCIKFLFFLILLYFAPLAESAYQEWELEYKGEKQKIHYQLYKPKGDHKDDSAVLICVGGLPIVDGEYVYQNTDECFSEPWFKFADEHNIAILGAGFLFNEQQWEQKESYQYAQAWSGNGVMAILESLAKTHQLDLNNIYAFGISAGAQFSVRLAQFFPDKVHAVAAHAAGGYDFPEEYIATKFLITVGELDDGDITRVQWAQAFVDAALKHDIDVRLEIVPDIAHVQTEYQNEMSRQFIIQQNKERQ